MRWLFLDRIEALEPGRRAIATATFEADGAVDRVHFPWHPIVPGVLQIEAMAQLACRLVMVTRLLAEQPWKYPILALVQDAKFRRFVGFDTPVRVQAELQALDEGRATARCRVEVDGRQLSSCTQLISLFGHAPGTPDEGLRPTIEFERDNLARTWPAFDPAPWDCLLQTLD